MPPYIPMSERGERELQSISDDDSVYGVLRNNNETTRKVHTSTLEVDYDKNITDLYKAITNCDWDAAVGAANMHPEEARTWVVRHYEEDDNDSRGTREIMWRFLPIHSASARQPPRGVVSALLKAYPDGAKCVDDQGMYALHYACGNQAHRDVIRMLLIAFPDAASMQDPNGMLPLHYLACWGPSDISIMNMVLVAHREAAHARDADGNIPLDLAVEGEYDERDQVVNMLQQWTTTDQNSVRSRDSFGSGRRSPSSSVHFEEKSFEGPDSTVLSTPQSHATGITPTSDPHAQTAASTPFLVSRLKDEISVLKERLKESKWELAATKNLESDTSLKQKIISLEKKVARQQDELELTREELDEVQNELEGKEEEIQRKTKENEELQNKLKDALSERVGLRLTLTDLMEQHEKFKKKSDFMNDRLGSLSASLSSMMEQHKTVLKAMKDREDASKKSASGRKKQLEALMALETEIEEDESLETALDKTHKEMEAISAIIAAARN